MKKLINYSLLIFLFSFIALACSKEDDLDGLKIKDLNESRGELDAPSLACGESGKDYIDIVVTAGNSGASAGFSLQWILKSEFEQYGWEGAPTGSSYCEASFSGVPSESRYNLGSNESVTVRIGEGFLNDTGASSECNEALKCGKEYLFRAFAHNEPGKDGLGRSPFSYKIKCSTKECKEEKPCKYSPCAYSQGRYFNKGNKGKNWPAGVEYVKVGNYKLRRGIDTLPATTPERRALFQAGALILSAKELNISLYEYIKCLPDDVKDAFKCIVEYYKDESKPAPCNLQTAASTIGDWIDKNHCEDKDSKD